MNLFLKFHYQSERNKWRWLQISCFLSSYFSQFFNFENFLTFIYLEIFANIRVLPIFPTRLTGLKHCTGYKVRWCQKKMNVKCVSFSCLIMY